jgi:hypothetical protein
VVHTSDVRLLNRRSRVVSVVLRLSMALRWSRPSSPILFFDKRSRLIRVLVINTWHSSSTAQ